MRDNPATERFGDDSAAGDLIRESQYMDYEWYRATAPPSTGTAE